MSGTQAVWAAAALVNAAAFLLYGWDKLAARRGWRRVPERRLLGVAALGGPVGAWAGVLVFRHKTRKAAFLLPLLLISAGWAAAGAWAAFGRGP